jgi:6,7-dimethyl-8-ribityllumazine synthase
VAREIVPSADGSGVRVGIAVARFNSYVTHRMLAVCVARLEELGIIGDAVTVVHAPGAVELPLVAKKLAARDDIDAVITIGAVINGETAHFEHVASIASDGVARVAEEAGKPVIFGILTTYSTDQAVARVPHAASYADAAVEMVNTYRALGDI